MTIQVPEEFDLCVIGCGPGGFAAAMRALDVGKHVCIVEGSEIGGAGVLWGAMASKTLWELAKDYSCAAKVDRGYRSASLSVDYQAVRRTVIQAAKEKQYQMLSQIETFSPERWNGPGSISLRRGRGRFVSPHELEILRADKGHERIRAKNFLISTGSRPRGFAHVQTDQERILNSDAILNLEEFPRRLMIIGAGVIGCEYASIFSNFQQTKVYLVDHKERVIPYEDDDVSAFVSGNLISNGVDILQSAQLREIVKKPTHLEVILDFLDGHSEVVEVDAALISIGRQPNLEGLNLEAAGIAPNERGYLEVDGSCRVKDHIFAAGDVTQHPQLVSVAEMQARYAVKAMFGFTRWPLRYHNMSTIMFFSPAVATVGLSEKACREMKIPYRVGIYRNALVPRAIAMRATHGFVKIIVSDDERQLILGMRAGGPQVSSTIMSIAMLMDQERGIHEVLKSVHPHPAMSEGIQECLRLLLGKSIYKPQAFPKYLTIGHWHPDKGYFQE